MLAVFTTYRYIFLNKKSIYSCILAFLFQGPSVGLYLLAPNRSKQRELAWISDSQACLLPQIELINYIVARASPLTIHFLRGQGSANCTVIMSASKSLEGPSSIAFLEPGPTGTDRGPQAAIKGEPPGPGELAKCRRNTGLLI